MSAMLGPFLLVNLYHQDVLFFLHLFSAPIFHGQSELRNPMLFLRVFKLG